MLLAVVGACAEGQTVLTNAEVCRHKECDRIAEMRKALTAMGADVEERPDGLVIRKSRCAGRRSTAARDHRMVMTLAVAGLPPTAGRPSRNVECVKKTFADFVTEMQGLGADMDTQVSYALLRARAARMSAEWRSGLHRRTATRHWEPVPISRAW